MGATLRRTLVPWSANAGAQLGQACPVSHYLSRMLHTARAPTHTLPDAAMVFRPSPRAGYHPRCGGDTGKQQPERLSRNARLEAVRGDHFGSLR